MGQNVLIVSIRYRRERPHERQSKKYDQHDIVTLRSLCYTSHAYGEVSHLANKIDDCHTLSYARLLKKASAHPDGWRDRPYDTQQPAGVDDCITPDMVLTPAENCA